MALSNFAAVEKFHPLCTAHVHDFEIVHPPFNDGNGLLISVLYSAWILTNYQEWKFRTSLEPIYLAWKSYTF